MVAVQGAELREITVSKVIVFVIIDIVPVVVGIVCRTRPILLLFFEVVDIGRKVRYDGKFGIVIFIFVVFIHLSTLSSSSSLSYIFLLLLLLHISYETSFSSV